MSSLVTAAQEQAWGTPSVTLPEEEPFKDTVLNALVKQLRPEGEIGARILRREATGQDQRNPRVCKVHLGG